jgi:hypothetical protein
VRLKVAYATAGQRESLSVSLELAIIPLDKDAILRRCVARTVAIIRESGLPHHFGPISACVEGDWEEIMGLITRCFYGVGAGLPPPPHGHTRGLAVRRNRAFGDHGAFLP